MKVTVTVKAGAKVEDVSASMGEGLIVRVKEPAKEGRANRAMVKLLAAYYGVPQSSIRIASGAASKHKIVEITDSR